MKTIKEKVGSFVDFPKKFKIRDRQTWSRSNNVRRDVATCQRVTELKQIGDTKELRGRHANATA